MPYSSCYSVKRFDCSRGSRVSVVLLQPANDDTTLEITALIHIVTIGSAVRLVNRGTEETEKVVSIV